MNLRIDSIAVLALLLSCSVMPSAALGQAADGEPSSVSEPIKADFKGAIGLGLIGAELGFVIPAVAGLRAAWGYVLFPTLGAAGGALAGYYALERGEGEPELAVAALITGMALVIPATVVTLAASAYEPDTELPTTAALRSRRAAIEAGPGLLRVSPRGIFVAAPAIAVAANGPARARTLRVPIVSGAF
jgi:hypothetical protein